MAAKKSESLEFLKVGEAISQGLHDGLNHPYPLEEVEEDPVWAEEWAKEWAKENPYLKMDVETVRAVATITLRIIDNLMPGIQIHTFAKRPDNKRLMHLASHGKKKRTRKKNIHRLLEKYKKENDRRMI